MGAAESRRRAGGVAGESGGYEGDIGGGCEGGAGELRARSRQGTDETTLL